MSRAGLLLMLSKSTLRFTDNFAFSVALKKGKHFSREPKIFSQTGMQQKVGLRTLLSLKTLKQQHLIA